MPAPALPPGPMGGDTDTLVTQVVDELTRLLTRASPGPPPDPVGTTGEARRHALPRLRVLAGVKLTVGHPETGRTVGTSRQGARRRRPGLVTNSTDHSTRPTHRSSPIMAAAAIRPYDVLLVEDDVADAMLIQDALTERGTRNLTQVSNGVEALDYLRDPDNARPDLIVLDLNMPRMNGREFLAVVKEDAELRTIPVVVLTTSVAPDDVNGAYHHHANAYVTKPVNLEEFERAVRSIDAFYLDIAVKPPKE
jgi:CheY-like chemotaxis protein